MFRGQWDRTDRTENLRYAAIVGTSLQVPTVSQRNIGRALRRAQFNAKDESGHPTFALLHELDERGEALPVPHDALPSMHSFPHVASRALLAGESIDEVAFLLGHRDANVTRAVYFRELSDARRRTMRRSRIAAEYAELLKAPGVTLE